MSILPATYKLNDFTKQNQLFKLIKLVSKLNNLNNLGIFLVQDEKLRNQSVILSFIPVS